jgi:formyltetrahydrofolate hydrolase
MEHYVLTLRCADQPGTVRAQTEDRVVLAGARTVVFD